MRNNDDDARQAIGKWMTLANIHKRRLATATENLNFLREAVAEFIEAVQQQDADRITAAFDSLVAEYEYNTKE